MRLITPVLCLLIGVVWFDLAFGRGNIPEVRALQRKLDLQMAANEAARAQNARVQAEVADLQDGTESIEASARRDLGMVGPNEFLVVYARRP
jgi:cell division protein FtsB